MRRYCGLSAWSDPSVNINFVSFSCVRQAKVWLVGTFDANSKITYCSLHSFKLQDFFAWLIILLKYFYHEMHNMHFLLSNMYISC